MISREQRQHMRERLDDPEYRRWLVRTWRWFSVVLMPPLLWRVHGRRASYYEVLGNRRDIYLHPP